MISCDLYESRCRIAYLIQKDFVGLGIQAPLRRACIADPSDSYGTQ